MKLTVLRPFYTDGGALAERGSVVDVEKAAAMSLISCGKAELAPGQSAPAYEPMTIGNTPALVPGRPAKAGKGKSHVGE